MSTELSTSSRAQKALTQALWDVWFPKQASQRAGEGRSAAPFWARTVVWLGQPLLLAVASLVRRVAKRRALDQVRAPRLPATPVVSIGNAIVGGTGKTPAVLLLIQVLRSAGFYPGVVSRGYGRDPRQPIVVLQPNQLTQMDAREVGDEPWLIAWRSQAPVAVSQDRYQAAQALLMANPQVNVILLDDGMSQTSLAVDHHLMVVDHRLHGNQRCLPAGPLRMAWPGCPPKGLRIDAVMLREPSLPVDRLFAQTTEQPAVLRPTTTLTGWLPLLPDTAGPYGPDTALSAALSVAPSAAAHRLVLTTIANPSAFHASLAQLGLTWSWQISLPDHSPAPWQALDVALAGQAKAADQLLMTEKDAVKFLSAPEQLERLHHRFREGVWVLRQDLRLDPAQSAVLMDRLTTLKGPPCHGSQTA